MTSRYFRHCRAHQSRYVPHTSLPGSELDTAGLSRLLVSGVQNLFKELDTNQDNVLEEEEIAGVCCGVLLQRAGSENLEPRYVNRSVFCGQGRVAFEPDA